MMIATVSLVLAMVISAQGSSVSLPLPRIYTLCNIVSVLGEWNCDGLNGSVTCDYDYTGDYHTDIQDIVYLLLRWKGGSDCIDLPVTFEGDWTLSIRDDDGSGELCPPGSSKTYTCDVSFSGTGPVSEFVVQIVAPPNGASQIINDNTVKLTMERGGFPSTVWRTNDCVVTSGSGYSYLTCFSANQLKPGDQMHIQFTLQNLGSTASIGQFGINVITKDKSEKLRILPSKLPVDMRCGSTTTTTTVAPTTAPVAFGFYVDQINTGPLCGTASTAMNAVVAVTGGTEDSFLIRGSVRDTTANLTFSTARSSNPSQICSTYPRYFECIGSATGPLSITITFNVGVKAGSPAATQTPEISILAGYYYNSKLDVIEVQEFAQSIAC